MDTKQELFRYIDSRKESYIGLSGEIWHLAECRFQEFQSSEKIAHKLRQEGFTVEKGLSGMETAFLASWGQGKPVIAFLGEYDALEGLSQQADLPEKKPVQEGKSGHGCGHHLLGMAPALAAAACKEYMQAHGLHGTLRYYGCPAEENGAGKAFMARDGLFNDVDIVLAWHPASYDSISKSGTLASKKTFYQFYGKSAHAAESPYLGRSALDAVELMNVGCNFLREHAIPEARIHYAITDAGGKSPNIVQPYAQVLYDVRAPKMAYVAELAKRVDNVAKGAALMTDTKVTSKNVSAYAELVCNRTINEQIRLHLQELLDNSQYTPEELSYAQSFQDTLSKEDQNALESKLEQNGVSYLEARKLCDKPMFQGMLPDIPMVGSTDAGDVSQNAPTGHFTVACFALGTPLHSWQAVAQGLSSIAFGAMIKTAKVMALTARDFLEDTSLVEAAREEFQQTVKESGYICGLDPDTAPDIW